MTARPASSHGALDELPGSAELDGEMRPLLPRLPWFVVPTVIGVLQLVGTFAAARHVGVRAGTRPLDALAWVLVVLGSVVVVWFGRRYPLVALAATTLTVAIYNAYGYVNGPIYLMYVFTLIWAILKGYHVYAWLSVPVLFIAEYAVPVVFAGARWPDLSTFGVDLAWAIACLALAEGLNFRRQRVQATIRARRERIQRRTADERLAIARELHDVLAHSISLINVQAGTALEVMDRRPEQARVALEAIKHTSKQALSEVRSVLDAIRGPDAGGAPLVPTAGLELLPSLIARAEATGLKVKVETSGSAVELPAGVDLAAYRIVQEALTNVVRHAQATSATVLITYAEDSVRLRIADDGRGYSAAEMDGCGEGGNGLPGMRERALALGGGFSAGTRPGGGFAVEAALPLGRASNDNS